MNCFVDTPTSNSSLAKAAGFFLINNAARREDLDRFSQFAATGAAHHSWSLMRVEPDWLKVVKHAGAQYGVCVAAVRRNSLREKKKERIQATINLDEIRRKSKP